MVFLTVIAGLELAVIVVLLVLQARERDDDRESNAKVLADFCLAAERERDRLVSRIQRPDFVPPPLGEIPKRPPKDAKSLAGIGGYMPQPKRVQKPKKDAS